MCIPYETTRVLLLAQRLWLRGWDEHEAYKTALWIYAKRTERSRRKAS